MGNHHGTLPNLHQGSQDIIFTPQPANFFSPSQSSYSHASAPPGAQSGPSTVPPHAHHPSASPITPPRALLCIGRLVEDKYDNWYGRGIERATTERSGWGEGTMRVSWRGRGGQGRSWARSNGTQPYLLAYGVSAGARRAKATVGGENCAQKACGWWAHERQSAERCKVRRGRVRAIKRALERHEAVDMRMHRERARTVRT